MSPQFASYVCPMLVYVEMCVVIEPVLPIKFHTLTIQVKTREGYKKKNKFFFFLPGDIFAAFDFFRNEEKNKGEEAKGRRICV